jgi:hypothetical protein
VKGLKEWDVGGTALGLCAVAGCIISAEPCVLLSSASITYISVRS